MAPIKKNEAAVVSSPVVGCCYTRKEDQQRRQRQRLVWNIQQQSLTMKSISVRPSNVNGYSKDSTLYVLYNVSLVSDLVKGSSWVSSKRYSEFYRFRKSFLASSFCKCRHCTTTKKRIKAFEFPSRIHLIKKSQQSLVTQRTEGLEAFVLAVCEYLRLPKTYNFNTPVCRTFLGAQRRWKEFLNFPLDTEKLHIQAIRALVYYEASSLDNNDGELDSTCPICLSDFTRETLTPSMWLVRTGHCRHLFHPDCIHEWFKTRFDCPICRIATTTESPKINSYSPRSIEPSQTSSSSILFKL